MNSSGRALRGFSSDFEALDTVLAGEVTVGATLGSLILSILDNNQLELKFAAGSGAHSRAFESSLPVER